MTHNEAGDGGQDNPAFSHDEEGGSCNNSTSTASAGNSEVTANGNDGKSRTFVSQQCAEPARSGSAEPQQNQRKSETRIEVPEEAVPAPAKNGTPKPRQNGRPGNGNNNEVSFLNASVTSVANNEVNDKKEQIEAVNLELVSMKPYAGSNNHQTKNQEACEVPADPYEEYFVPVNEHRKCIRHANREVETTVAGVRFDLGPGVGREGLSLRDPAAGLVDYSHWLKALRGEKLYVTKDKRSNGSYWRRALCWGCGFLIIAIAAIIAILFGTGVILMPEATQPLLNEGKTDNGPLKEVHAAGSQEYIKNPPPSPPPRTSTAPTWPTTDETLYRYVPKALEGVIKLNDLDWNDDMNDRSSRVYRDVAKELEYNLVVMLRLDNDMPIVKVYSISKDGDIKFRISQPVYEKPEQNQEHLEKRFQQNGSMIGKYHVQRLMIASLVDQCHSGEMKCSDKCIYDYAEGIFMCTGQNGLNTGLETVQGRSRTPDDIYSDNHDWDHSHFGLHYDHDHSSHDMNVNPEIVSESEPSAEPKSESEPAAESEPSSEPKSEPEPAAELEPSSEPKSEPEPSSEPKSEPEPAAELEPSSEPKSEPEPSSEPKSEPEPAAELEPSSEPKSEPEPSSEPKSEPEPAAEPEPSSEPESEPEPSSEPKSEPEPSSEPKSEPEPAAELEPSSEPKSEPEPSSEPKSEPEPSSEPKSEPEPAAEPEPSSEPESEPEPSSEPKSEPESAKEPEPSSEPKSEPEPVSETKSEPEPTPELESSAEPKSSSEPSADEPRVSVESKSKPELIYEPKGESEPKSEPEPVTQPEPSAEPKVESELISEPKSEPEPVSELEPSAESKGEPESVSKPEPSTEPKSVPEPAVEPEPSVEPKSEPEPVVESESSTGPKSNTEPSANQPEMSAEPKSKSEAVVKSKLSFESQHESQLKAESQSEQKSATETGVSVEPKTEPEPVVEPEPSAELKSEPEPVSEPEPSAEPKSEPETVSEPEPSAESKGESDPVSEPKSEPEPVSELEPSAEPTSEPEPVSEPESSVKLKSEAALAVEPEPFPDPKREPEPIPEPDSSVEPKSEAEIHSSTESKSSSELSPEPVSVTEASPSVEPRSAAKSETSVERRSKLGLTSDSISEINSAFGGEPFVEVNDEPEPSTEPKSESVSPLDAKGAAESTAEPEVTTESEGEAVREPIGGSESTTDLKPDEEPRVERKNATEGSKADRSEETAESITEQPSSEKMPSSPSDSPSVDAATDGEEAMLLTTQKPPRLDNDEKDGPNPFESNVKDVESTTAADKVEIATERSFAHKMAGANESATRQSHEPPSVLGESADSNDGYGHNILKASNAEDHYNDITDDFADGFDKNDIESKDVKKDEKSKKLKSKNIDYSKIETVPDSTTEFAVSTASEKALDDIKMTSRIPILPIEIQMDTTTTEDNTSVETPVESSASPREQVEPTTTERATQIDARTTTEPMPILPEELLTTDSDKEDPRETTEPYELRKIDKDPVDFDDDGGRSKGTSGRSSDESTTPREVVERTTNYVVSDRNEMMIAAEVKPVFEPISDDTTPQTFEFVLPNSGKSSQPEPLGELTEEQLRVIPLEAKSETPSPGPRDEKPKANAETSEHKAELAKSSRTLDDEGTVRSTLDESGAGEERTIFVSSVPKISEVVQADAPKSEPPSSNETVKYKNFIPVSEDIDESDYPGTQAPAMIAPELNENKAEREVSGAGNSSVIEAGGLSRKAAAGEEGPDKVGEARSKAESAAAVPVATPPLFFSKCKSGQFQCANGTARDGAYCVSLSAKCDSENDCSDGSDELDCERQGCPGNFQCASGQCLKRHLVCNGIVDCDDGSDERTCAQWKCNFDEFQCPNGRCIPVLWQCDGRPDCENHADEYHCSESCNNDEYLCPNEKWCIPQTWRCNGVPECENGEDEKLCECGLDQFKCDTGGCVPADQLCDGVENCPDRSDEWNCLAGLKNASLPADLDRENKDEAMRGSPIKMRLSNGDYKFICSDGWSEEFSDLYCRTQGFAESDSTQFVEQGAGQPYLRLKADANSNSSLVTNLERVDACKSKKIVEVSCQEFSCGSHESVGPTARLVGGTAVSKGQWSSVALLKEPKHGSACTASVLSPMHALASYSCVHSFRQSSGWQLFVGGNLLKAHRVKNILPYPQVKYNQFLYNNDIAIVELAEPLVFSRNVSAVCLPSQAFQPRQLCVTAGWGFPVNGEVDLQQYLKFLPVPTYDSEECNATSHYAGFITKHNICAGFTDTDKGPCYNDEGAPLMCVSEAGRWEIQGLLSHHSRCSRGHPAIYSSIAPALSWLRNSVPSLQTFA